MAGYKSFWQDPYSPIIGGVLNGALNAGTALTKIPLPKDLAARTMGAAGQAAKYGAKWLTTGIKTSHGNASLWGTAMAIKEDLALGWAEGGMFSAGGSTLLAGAAIGIGAMAIGEGIHSSFTRMSGGMGGPEFLDRNPGMSDSSVQKAQLLREQRAFEQSASGLALSLHAIRGRAVHAASGFSRG